MTVTIRTRSQWKARPIEGVPDRIDPTPRLWLHHTAGPDRPTDGEIQATQRFHQDVRGWTDIAYSFLVGSDGTMWEGRGALIAGGHTKGDNHTSHAICAVGNYQVIPPSAALLESIAQLVAHGYRQRWWLCDRITGGHRSAPGANTVCPGDLLHARIGFINERVQQILGQHHPTPTPTPPTEDIDMTRDELRAELDAHGMKVVAAITDTLGPIVDLLQRDYAYDRASAELGDQATFAAIKKRAGEIHASLKD